MFGIVTLIRLSPLQLIDPLMLKGLIVLSCLPTTISMSFMMSTLMGANEGAALFNSTIGNFIGIFVSPLSILLLIGEGSGTTDIPGAILNLFLTVLLPLLGGIALQFLGKKILLAHGVRIRFWADLLNKVCLIIIVFFGKHACV